MTNNHASKSISDPFAPVTQSRWIKALVVQLKSPMHFPLASFALTYHAVRLVIGIMALSLLFYLYGGFYVRPLADDYLFAVNFKHEGVLVVYWWWTNLLGRWFSIALISAMVGHDFLLWPLLPGLVLSAWLWGLFKGLHALIDDKEASASLAITILACSLALAPNSVESLFWVCSLLFHTLPLSLTGLAGFLLAKRTCPLPIVALFFFCLAGCSETFDATIAPILIAMMVWKRNRLSFVVAICFLAGMSVMIMAPGNEVRSAPYLVADKSLIHVLWRSWSLGLYFYRGAFDSTLFVGVGAAFIIGLGSLSLTRPKFQWIFASLTFSFYSAIMTQAPSVYGTGRIPEGRAMIATSYFVCTGIIGAAFLFGLWVRPFARRFRECPSHFHSVVLGILLWSGASCGVPMLHEGIERVLTMRSFSRTWALRKAEICRQVASGAKKVRVLPLHLIGLDVRGDAAFYVNSSMAEYYSPAHPIEILPEPTAK